MLNNLILILIIQLPFDPHISSTTSSSSPPFSTLLIRVSSVTSSLSPSFTSLLTLIFSTTSSSPPSFSSLLILTSSTTSSSSPSFNSLLMRILNPFRVLYSLKPTSGFRVNPFSLTFHCLHNLGWISLRVCYLHTAIEWSLRSTITTVNSPRPNPYTSIVDSWDNRGEYKRLLSVLI